MGSDLSFRIALIVSERSPVALVIVAMFMK